MSVIGFGIILILLCTLPLSISSIVMGSIHWNQCKLAATAPTPVAPPPDLPPQFIITPDASPIAAGNLENDLNRWLIIYGSVFIAMSLAQVFILEIYEYDSRRPRLLFMFFHIAWAVAWIIYGGIILFGTPGKTCKNSLDTGGFRVWQTTLAMWILMILGIPILISTTCWVAFD